jgi:hypothetical protein
MKQVWWPARLPPSEVRKASQLPPSRLPATIVFFRVSGFCWGGMLGTKSDSATPIPPPAGASLRHTVVFTTLKSASASWNMPPPRTLARLCEMVVFSISPPPSLML